MRCERASCSKLRRKGELFKTSAKLKGNVTVVVVGGGMGEAQEAVQVFGATNDLHCYNVVDGGGRVFDRKHCEVHAKSHPGGSFPQLLSE